MKYYLLLVLSLYSYIIQAQMCPGGGVDFNTAVTFDPAWIYGCNTGTSCNGGVNFDNRSACLPSTIMDACAPAPSCGNISHDASNVWFKFYASSSNITISCFQNTSLIIGVQAFNGGPTCGSLSEIGCAVSSGPSSGVTLNLPGLIPGHLYYFRIFGSAIPISQRTGLYCFCGSTGLNNFILSSSSVNFSATVAGNNVQLSWSGTLDNEISSFDIERSPDGINFNKIFTLPASGNTNRAGYSYTDASPLEGSDFYRIKQFSAGGQFAYSPIVVVKANNLKGFSIVTATGKKELLVNATRNDQFIIYNTMGQIIKSFDAKTGLNNISTTGMPIGSYLIHSKTFNTVKRFCVI